MTLDRQLNTAIAHHQAGQLQQAEAIYRQILSARPDHPDALHLLGVLASQVGRQDIAIDLIRKSLAANPRNADAHSNLGNALRANKQIAEAIASYQTAISLNPNSPEALLNLGNALNDQKDYASAIVAYEKSLRLQPSDARTLNNLGTALRNTGKLDDAVASFQKAIDSNPAFAEPWANLGRGLFRQRKSAEAVSAFERSIRLGANDAEVWSDYGVALSAVGRTPDAAECHRRAIELAPDRAWAYNNLGIALHSMGRLEDALVPLRRAVELDPNDAQAFTNLGTTYNKMGHGDQAVIACRRAAELAPNNVDVLSNLAHALTQEALIEEALAVYRRALELRPDDAVLHDNLLLAMHYPPDVSPEVIAEMHRDWDRRHGQPHEHKAKPHRNSIDPERRLRIGYISGDFCGHVLSRFFPPILREHDRTQVEAICYANVDAPDSLTKQYQSLADGWRDVLAMDDDQAAELIHEDQIDILVDLAGHTACNRLPVFARRPAPIQVTYFGYPNTSGMRTIDYRLTDAEADPPGMTESYHSEKLYRLPLGDWCYEPHEQSPEITPLPALRGKGVTFGSFNLNAKTTEPMLRTWGNILKRVPNSSLLLKAKALNSPTARKRALDVIVREGVDASRIRFMGGGNHIEHMKAYEQLDIALDPLPYHGTTTTCEAMWMGVPVITLAGRTHESRVGVSLLTRVGFAEFIAQGAEEYIEIAVKLAADLDRLSELRRTMRERMKASPLMDAPRFTRALEAAYRQMWRDYCALALQMAPK